MFFDKKDIVRIKLITLVGEPWFWKSFLALFFAMRFNEIFMRQNHWNIHPRIFWNLDILYKDDVISKPISYCSLEKIEFSEIPWLLLFDETFQNAWARDSLSKENKTIVNELWALGRKKNLNTIFMAQSSRMIDVLIRDLSYITIELKEPFFNYEEYWDWRLIFHWEIYKNWVLMAFPEFNLFELLKMWYKHDTLQTSKLQKINRNKKIKTKEDQEIEFLF